MTETQLYAYNEFYLIDAEFDTVDGADNQELSDYLPNECDALEAD